MNMIPRRSRSSSSSRPPNQRLLLLLRFSCWWNVTVATTALCLCVLTDVTTGLSVPPKKEVATLFEFGNISLGSKKAKKRIMNAASKTAKDLAKLSQEHQRLNQQIEALDKPKYHSVELKHLKRRKLALKDAIMSLRKHSRDHPPNNDVVVGSGGFADVWLGHQVVVTGTGETQEKEPVAVKISRSSADNAALLREARLIQSLHAYPGFVRVQHVAWNVGEQRQQTAVVLDLLGPSLEDLWWSCTCGAGGLSGPTVLKVADEMLQRLHALLRTGIVHRDLQPANMLMGRVGEARNVPHLIDFGISMTSLNHATSSTCTSSSEIQQEQAQSQPGESPPPPPRHAFSGTPRFASVSALMAHGGGNRAADDLESLCYTLAFLRSGSMPWSDQAEQDAMRDNEGSRALALMKQQTDPSEICGTELIADPAAKAIAALLQHARSTTTTGALPDYNLCRRIVKEALAQVEPQERYAPPDWEQHSVTWSPDKGSLQNTLYSNDA
jgi:serine/threonine protein kinase